MNRKLICIINFVLFLSLVCCKKNNAYDKPIELSAIEIQNYLEEKNNIKDKLTEILRNIDTDKGNSDQILPSEYIDFYGKMKEEILNNLGNDYSISRQEDIPEEYGWDYNKKENINYSGISFNISLNDETSKINYFYITGGDIKYVGNIFVGCSITDVINQLGKPTAVDIVTNNFIYYSQSIRIAFTVTYESKIKSIYVSDYTESYNLDFNPKD
jgi:hypothetical protein